MENTGKVLFEDASPVWFIALGAKWVGPLAAADVYRKVSRQEISWAHYIWRKGMKDWQRICDVPAFQALVPGAPSRTMQEEVADRSEEFVRPGAVSGNRAAAAKPVVKSVAPKQASAKKAPPPAPPREDENSEERIWYMHTNDTQYGPFSTGEIGAMVDNGKIHGRVYLWRDGMSGWERLEKLVQFTGKVKASPAAEMKANQRKAPRKPLVAKILLANDEDVVTAVCRDISVGGMQVLTDKIPGAVGEKIKMNVSPADAEKSKFRPFVAEGVIVRVLEDGRGFSFRFSRLTDAAKRSIESYVESERG